MRNHFPNPPMLLGGSLQKSSDSPIDFPFLTAYPRVMTHTEALNMILANNCPAHLDLDTGVATFVIPVHCVTFQVCARLKAITPESGIEYDILSCTFLND
jgi:hypothetical protein